MRQRQQHDAIPTALDSGHRRHGDRDVVLVTVKVTFTSRSGDNSYTIERAEGAAAAFAQVGNGHRAGDAGHGHVHGQRTSRSNTLYRYRVITAVGTADTSRRRAKRSVTTLDVGNAAADITTDITASRTLYADTVYTLKGFIHVANGATLTIQPGTKIQGDFNTLGSSLFILRGAKIAGGRHGRRCRSSSRRRAPPVSGSPATGAV